MTPLEFLILLLVAGLCGSLAQGITGYSHGGCLVSIAIGFVGALLGQWFARLAGVGEIFSVRIGSETFPIVWSIIGATVFVAVLNLLTARRMV